MPTKIQTGLQALAQSVLDNMEERARGEVMFWTLKKERPDWMQELAHEAHGDMMPDDTRYVFIHDALVQLADIADPDEIYLSADDYTSELTAWLNSRADRYSYCDEAAEERGENPIGILALLRMGQEAEKNEVLGLVRSFLEDMVEDIRESLED